MSREGKRVSSSRAGEVRRVSIDDFYKVLGITIRFCGLRRGDNDTHSKPL